MNRTISRMWVWLGLGMGALPYFGLAQPPAVGLEALSIFFGGLLAIASILPSTSGFEKIKELHETGHIDDLISFIYLPLWLSFILILTAIAGSALTINFIELIPNSVLQGMLLAVWGVFLLSLVRIVMILPHLLTDHSKK